MRGRRISYRSKLVYFFQNYVFHFLTLHSSVILVKTIRKYFFCNNAEELGPGITLHVIHILFFYDVFYTLYCLNIFSCITANVHMYKCILGNHGRSPRIHDIHTCCRALDTTRVCRSQDSNPRPPACEVNGLPIDPLERQFIQI